MIDLPPDVLAARTRCEAIIAALRRRGISDEHPMLQAARDAFAQEFAEYIGMPIEDVHAWWAELDARGSGDAA